MSEPNRQRVEVIADGDDPAERAARVERYAQLVAERGGWKRGYVFGPPTKAKSLDWLAAQWKPEEP